jgi:hypothetical protein
MSDDEALHDLAVRARQLEAHLLRSPEYLLKVRRKAAWLALVFGAAILLFFGEEIFYLREPKPNSTFVLGSIDFTLVIILTSGVLLIRTRGFRHRLNESWLNPEAKKTLDALRRERTERNSPASSAPGTA